MRRNCRVWLQVTEKKTPICDRVERVAERAKRSLMNEQFVMVAGSRERGGNEIEGEVAGCGHNFFDEMSIFLSAYFRSEMALGHY